MANPFENNQNTTGGKAGFAAFEELRTDKAYDDETLKPNPGAPLPAPSGSVPEFLESRDNVTPPDYEGIQLQKFKDFKKIQGEGGSVEPGCKGIPAVNSGV